MKVIWLVTCTFWEMLRKNKYPKVEAGEYSETFSQNLNLCRDWNSFCDSMFSIPHPGLLCNFAFENVYL